MLSEIIEKNYNDVENFGIDLVSEDKHTPIIIDDEYEFGVDKVNEVFNFSSLQQHKSR